MRQPPFSARADETQAGTKRKEDDAEAIGFYTHFSRLDTAGREWGETRKRWMRVSAAASLFPYSALFLFQELRYVEEAQIARSKRNIGRQEGKEKERRKRRREKLYTSCYTCYMDILPFSTHFCLFFSPSLLWVREEEMEDGSSYPLTTLYLLPFFLMSWTQSIDQSKRMFQVYNIYICLWHRWPSRYYKSLRAAELHRLTRSIYLPSASSPTAVIKTDSFFFLQTSITYRPNTKEEGKNQLHTSIDRLFTDKGYTVSSFYFFPPQKKD